MEFAEIYSHYYQELLKRGCLDEKFQAMQLCKLLSEDTPVGPNYGVVIFDGFDRYNRLQVQLAKRLAARSQKVLILFDYVQGSEDYIWKESCYRMLEQELSIEPNIIPARTHKTAAFDSFTSLDRFTEMQEIARQTKLLITTGQAKPGDVLVTARRIRAYQGAASAAFENFGIPHFLNRKYSVNAFPITQFVLALLGLHVNDFLRQDVMAVLTSRYFAADGFENSDVENIDQESLAAFVLKGRTDWNRGLNDPEHKQFKIKLDNLFEQLTPSPEPKTFADHCRWCEDKLVTYANFGSANILDYATGSCLEALRNAFATLIEEERVLASGPVDYNTFYQNLKEELEAASFRSKAAGGECVTICDAELVPNRTYKFVFIAGMLEGEFPAKERHLTFVGPEDLEAWRRRDVFVDNPRVHTGYEDALLKMITQSASEKIFMSCPRYDTKAKDKEELLPSFALQQFFEDKSPRYLPVYEEALNFPCSLKDITSAMLWQEPDTNIEMLEPLLPEHLEYLNNLQACIIPSRTRLSATRQSCFNGYLVDLVESGVLPIAMPKYLSATSLDHYGKCPFQFWSTDILKLAPRQEVDPRNQHKLIGNFYHHVLEGFYNQVIERRIPMSRDNKAQLQILFDAAVSNGIVWLENNPEFHADEFWTYRKKFIRLLLDKFFEHELSLFSSDVAEFQPALCEAGFGKGGKFPALELEAGGGRTIAVRGKIDRIDLNKEKTHARIVDYKRSAYGLSIRGILSAQALQLPVYSLALTNVIAPGCKVSRAEYAIVGKAESKAVDGVSSVENAMQNARLQIQEHETNIRRGNFLVQPGHGSYCRNCSQRKVCRIGELPTVGQADAN
jgi:ATP-dependent helicase/nuclease subunit B